MTQLEQIKAELAALTERVSTLTESTGEISLTREQLKKIINATIKQTMEQVEYEINSISIDESCVELDLNGFEISVTIDDNAVKDDINDNVLSNVDTEISETDLDDLIDSVKEENI